MIPMKATINTTVNASAQNLEIMSIEESRKAEAFHKSMPGYSPTPLAKLDNLASYLGLGSVFVKDESFRFGLNSFKVLGGSFAMARYIAGKLDVDVGALDYSTLVSNEIRRKLGDITFFTATDGNHGRGVAWAANRLKQKSVVYMPKGSSQTRLNNILAEGADASIKDFNYDECVRLAAAEARKLKNGVIVQDTAWDGYEDIPTYIMQGYSTMAIEASRQLGGRPTHVFVQAGVGSLAGAVQGYFANLYPDSCPITVVLEAQAADCHYRSAMTPNKSILKVGGDLQTIMAGLACGELNPISWEILKAKTSCFISAPDWVSAYGMRILASPIKGDSQVISGESGAAPTGALAAIMLMDEYADLRESLKLDKNSKVLLFSTEGDTDPDMYRQIVWSRDWKE